MTLAWTGRYNVSQMKPLGRRAGVKAPQENGFKEFEEWSLKSRRMWRETILSKDEKKNSNKIISWHLLACTSQTGYRWRDSSYVFPHINSISSRLTLWSCYYKLSLLRYVKLHSKSLSALFCTVTGHCSLHSHHPNLPKYRSGYKHECDTYIHEGFFLPPGLKRVKWTSPKWCVNNVFLLISFFLLSTSTSSKKMLKLIIQSCQYRFWSIMD